MSHTPVMVAEVLEHLDPRPGETIVDATVNGGGHARAIRERIGERGTLVGVDADAQAAAGAEEYLTHFIQGNFRDLQALLARVGIGEIQGALFDLGWSAHHLSRAGRGFTFQREEPLLMTYDGDPPKNALTARTIVNFWNEDDIAGVIRDYGEERYADRIARGIVSARQRSPIMTTFELVDVIRTSVPAYYRTARLHPATRTFQALRIAVNDELNALTEGLAAAYAMLTPGGRIVAISFHSLEDRVVKNFFRTRAIHPSRDELLRNPRARSAKLRALKKA